MSARRRRKFKLAIKFPKVDVPGAPEAPHADITVTKSMVATWKPPENDGGSNIKGYILEIRCKERDTWTIRSKEEVSGTRFHFIEADRGVEYQFRVFAINHAGVGKPSALSSSVTLPIPDVPGSPGVPQVEVKDIHSITVTWAPPKDDGGCKIEGYILEIWDNERGVSWTERSKLEVSVTMYLFTEAVSGVGYRFRVFAVNHAGVGKSSLLSKPVKYPETRKLVHSRDDIAIEHQTEEDEEDLKNWVKDQIKFGIKTKNCKLKEVISNIQNSDRWKYRSLSPKEESFVRSTYMEYSITEIVEKVRSFLIESKADLLRDISPLLISVGKFKHRGVNLLELLNELSKLVTCSEVVDSLRTNVCNFLEVTDNRNSLKCHSLIEKSLNDFIMNNVENYQVESDFLQELTKYITFCFQHNKVNTLISDLNPDMDKTILTSDILQRIKCSEGHKELKKLKILATKIWRKVSAYLQDNVQKILREYNYPLHIGDSNENNRLIISCTCPVIDLKVAIKKLQERYSVEKADEIHFIANKCMHANDSFSWSGKNVVFVADEIHVSEIQQWDVSGKDAGHYDTKAEDGRRSGDDGRPGEHGKHGESGGNVCVIANRIVNAEKLTITSNGGNGGNGQDGGNGMDGEDGKDGKGITLEQFKEKYKPDGRCISTDTNANTYPVESGEYSEVETPNGNIITIFSQYNSMFNGQSYCIHYGAQGTRGQAGGDGGKGGDPGKGGCRGNVQVLNKSTQEENTFAINIGPKDGEDGQKGNDGTGGKGGEHGTKGPDNAWVLSNTKVLTPSYSHGQLGIQYERGKWNDFGIAYCPYHEKHARIVEKKMEKCGKAEDGNAGKTERKRAQDRQVRKLHIDSQHILARYNDVLQDKTFDLTDTCQVSDMMENPQEMSVNGNRTITRHIVFEGTRHTHQKYELPRKSNERDLPVFDGSVLKKTTVSDDHLAPIVSALRDTSSITDLISSLRKLRQTIDVELLKDKGITNVLAEVFNVLQENFKRVAFTKGENESLYQCLTELRQVLNDQASNFSIFERTDTDAVKILVGTCDQLLDTLLKKYAMSSVNNLAEEIEAKTRETLKTIWAVSPLERRTQMYLRRTRNRLIVDCFLKIMRLNHKKEIDDCLEDVEKRVQNEFIPDILATIQPDGTLGTEIHKGYFCIVPSTPRYIESPDGNQETGEFASPNVEAQILPECLQFLGEKANEVKAILMFRFSCEGCLLSEREQKEMRDAILSCGNDIVDMLELGSIITRYHQGHWISALLYYKVIKCIGESYTSTENVKARVFSIQSNEWVSFLNHKISLNEEFFVESDIHEVVDIISSFELDTATYTILKDLPVSEWKFDLRFIEIYRDLNSLGLEMKDSALAECSSRIWYLQNTSGRDMTTGFLAMLRDTRDLSSDVICLILRNFRANRWMFDGKALDVMKDTPCHQWAQELDNLFSPDRDRTVDELKDIINNDSNNSASVLKNNLVNAVDTIRNIDSKCKRKSAISPDPDKPLNDFDCENIRAWAVAFKDQVKCAANQEAFVADHIEEVVVVIRKAIELVKACTLRNTQILALVFFILNKDRGILQQISTGEGKSLVIVALAIIKHLVGQSVDILTSSLVLAKRDAKEYSDIYELFGATVAHNCSEAVRDRRQAYEASVVYGEIGTFQRDTLQDEFYDENILGQRKNDNILIDEVDSMLLDKGHNVLYLSHNIPGLDALEQVYVNIWSLVHSRGLHGSDEDVQLVKDIILSAIQGYTLTSEEVKQRLSACNNGFDVEQLFSYLHENCIINQDGQIIIHTQIKESKTPYKFQCPESVLSPEQARIVSCLLQEASQRKPKINVPNFLHSFIHRHLEAWIRNAFMARGMQEGEQYIIDVDRSENNRGKPSNVVIIDTETGTEQYNSQWHEGLHQFLQLKHGCRLSFESLKAVFMSNITFFKRYSPAIYGLTGTLGSRKERDLLQNLYDIDYVTIPTFRPSRFIEEETIVCSTEEEWQQQILESACKETEKGRPVLVVFETIRDVENIEKLCRQQNVIFQSYKRSHENIELLSDCKSSDKCLLLATNLAGRGTDIKINDEINKLGGLHVILTYLPTNIRIEQQAFGRSARKGQNGTGQMIIQDRDIGDDKIRMSEIMKIERDTNEEHRLGQIKSHFDTVIKTEEKLLADFKNLYEKLRKAIRYSHEHDEYGGLLGTIKQKMGFRKGREDLESVVLASCLDEWALALDKVQQAIGEGKDVFNQLNNDWLGKKRMEEGIQQLEKKTKNVLTDIVISPPRRVKLGLIMTSLGDHETAANIFTQVIEDEPKFAEMAHYYMVHCLMQMSKCSDDVQMKMTSHLDKAEHNIRQRTEECRTALSIALAIKDNFVDCRKSFLNSDDYCKQKEGLLCIYEEYLHSIESLRGSAVTTHMLTELTKDPIMAALLKEDLQELAILSRPKYSCNPLNNILELCEYYDEYFVNDIRSFITDDQYHNECLNAEDFAKLLPNREELWDLLKESGQMQDEKEYVVLYRRAIQESKVLDSSIKRQISDLKSNQDLQEFIVKSALEPKDGKPVIMYPEQLQVIDDDDLVVLNRSEFESKLGPLKTWEYCIRAKLLIINKTAFICEQPGTTLSRFDEIDATCFTICTDGDADECSAIFQHLQKIGVLSSGSQAYMKTGNLGGITIEGFEEYVIEVRKILRHHCAYRLAMLEFFADTEAITLPLESNPHERLFDCMIHHRIIQPVKVQNSLHTKDIQHKLKRLSIITKDDVAKAANQPEGNQNNNNNHDDTSIDMMFINIKECLLRKGICISKKDGIYIKDVSEDDLAKISTDLENMQIIIPVRMILFYKLNGRSIVDRLNDLLPKWMSKIVQTCDTPMSMLVEFVSFLTNDTKSSMSDELDGLSDSGFDKIIQIGEAKWTWKTNIKIAALLAAGASQICAAAALEIYTAGTGTFVAEGLSSEGFGDIMFGFESALSGHFSFESFCQRKKVSLLMTTICFGVGAYWSDGCQFSRYGHETGGNLLPTNLVGNALKNEVGARRLCEKFAYRAGKKFVEASLLGFGNAAMKKLVDTQVRQFVLERVKQHVLHALEQNFVEGGLNSHLSELYILVGRQEATRLFNKVLQDVEGKLQKSEKRKYYTTSFVNQLRQGLAQAQKKLRRSGSVMSDISQVTNTAFSFMDGVSALHSVYAVSMSTKKDILNDITTSLAREIEQQQRQGRIVVEVVSNNREEFAAEMRGLARKFISMRIESKIIEECVMPLSHVLVGYATKVIRKEIKTRYKAYQTERTREMFNKINQEYKQNLEKSKQNKQNKSGGNSSLDDDIEVQYRQKLTELAKTCRDPDLYAELIKEGIPLGIESLQAISELSGTEVIVHRKNNDENDAENKGKPLPPEDQNEPSKQGGGDTKGERQTKDGSGVKLKGPEKSDKNNGSSTLTNSRDDHHEQNKRDDQVNQCKTEQVTGATISQDESGETVLTSVFRPSTVNQEKSRYKQSNEDVEGTCNQAETRQVDAAAIEIIQTKDESGANVFITADGRQLKCPLEAVMSQLNNPGITKDKFVEEIRSNSVIRNSITRGYHEHFMNKGLASSDTCAKKPTHWKAVEEVMSHGNAAEYWKDRPESNLPCSNVCIRDDKAGNETSHAQIKEDESYSDQTTLSDKTAQANGSWKASMNDVPSRISTFLGGSKQDLQKGKYGKSKADIPSKTLVLHYIEAAEHFRIDKKYLVSITVRKETRLALYSGTNLKDGIIKALVTFCDSSLYDAEMKTQSYTDHRKKEEPGLSHEQFLKGLTRECYKAYQVAKLLNDGKAPACKRVPKLEPRDKYKADINDKLSNVTSIKDVGEIIRDPAPFESDDDGQHDEEYEVLMI